jgi:Carboxypeptidase regulatory-like domain
VAIRLAAFTLLISLAGRELLRAQNVVLAGSLSGRVTDQSGAVLARVPVVVKNLGTGVKLSLETNHAGLYRFPVLLPSTYSVTVSAKGFRDVVALVRVMVGRMETGSTNCSTTPSGTTVVTAPRWIGPVTW